MNPRLLKRFLSALGAVALVSGCDLDSKVVQSDDRSAGGSDEIDTRIAVDRTGSPVAAARVALVKAGDSSGTALAVSATGSDGSYPTFVVPDGYYSLLVRDSSGVTGRYVDSVRVVSRKLPTGRDTLLSLGSVSGVVRLLSGDSPTSVRLGLVGTDILSSAKSDGTFKIDLVPGGLYTLGAESSLDGYDRIYKRIQLKDGQNLVLPDTLVLPFTGLPAPTGLQVSQDTATGNVSVKWNAVRNPDLLGYVLEQVEGGFVTDTRFLTDTSWTDSLGAYWEALPLLGPWPDRSVTYRVRSRSASGAGDTKSAALAITAKPPEWTKRVDSVKVTMTTDTTTGVTELKWNAPKHPDVLEWSVTREVNGIQDCFARVNVGLWNDSECPDPIRKVVDSAKGKVDGNWTREIQIQSSALQYSVGLIRKRGFFEQLEEIFRKDSVAPLVEWRDSILDASKSVKSIEVVGKWLVIRYDFGGGSRITKDGLLWEDLPDTIYTKWASVGDSFWGLRQVDEATYSLTSRIAPGQWASQRITLDTDCAYVFSIFGDSGGPVIKCGNELWKWRNGALESFYEYPDPFLGWFIDQVWFDSNNGLKVGYSTGNFRDLIVLERQAGQSEFTNSDEVSFSNVGSNTHLSVWGELSTGDLVINRSPIKGGLIGSVRTKNKSTYRIPNPPGFQNIWDLIVWNDELWVLGNNNHLWKGKLNLPK